MKIKQFTYSKRCFFPPLDLTIGGGDKILLFGPNGIGKTSFLKEVAFQEREKNFFEGISSQNTFYSTYEPTFSSLSVTDALDVICKSQYQDFFNVSDFKSVPLKNLSAGQLQRFWLNLALNDSSDLILLDEPTVFLDFQSRQKLLTLIKEINCPVILSSHEFEFFKPVISMLVHVNFDKNNIYRMKEIQNLDINRLL